MKIPSNAITSPVADNAPTASVPATAISTSAKPADPGNVTVDPHALRQLADQLANTIGMTGQQVRFSVDDDTGKTVLRVTDAESGALLRQIPGDEALAMARILDQMKGVLIRQKA